MGPKTDINQWQWITFYFAFDFSPFCVPNFLVAESRLHLASLTFPEFQRADSKVINTNYGSEGRRSKGKVVKK